MSSLALKNYFEPEVKSVILHENTFEVDKHKTRKQTFQTWQRIDERLPWEGIDIFTCWLGVHFVCDLVLKIMGMFKGRLAVFWYHIQLSKIV